MSPPVHDQHIVAGRRQQRTGVPVLERQMRFAAAKINAAVKRPWRVDERKLHEATPLPNTSRAAAVPNFSSHADNRPTPSFTVVRGRQPVAAVNFDVSET